MTAKLILNSFAFLALMASMSFAKDPVPVSCFAYLKQSTTIEISYNRAFTLQDGKLNETKDTGNYSIRSTPNEMKIVKEGCQITHNCCGSCCYDETLMRCMRIFKCRFLEEYFI